MHETHQPKKRKIAVSSLKERLKEHGFFEFENTIQRTFNPSENVTVCMKIRNGNSLWVCIMFMQSRETVLIEDTSFGKYSDESKIKRIVNLQNNLNRLQNRKEELFPLLKNWEDFKKRNCIKFYFFQFLFCEHSKSIIIL